MLPAAPSLPDIRLSGIIVLSVVSSTLAVFFSVFRANRKGVASQPNRERLICTPAHDGPLFFCLKLIRLTKGEYCNALARQYKLLLVPASEFNLIRMNAALAFSGPMAICSVCH